MKLFRSGYAALVMTLMALVPLTAHAQLADRKMLTDEAVKNIMAAAEAEARANNWNVVIAIVDDGGHLLSLQRLNNTQPASIDIAIGKARTSAAFRRPSLMLDSMVSNRMSFLTVSADYVLLEGGLPIIVDGYTIGAVGVSGVTASQDAQIAQAGIAALRQ
jgi:glc operon protein GlcG